ncbi:response regulator transcription factor [Paenibacillus ihumii]|uniref:response regulator transcription factor n=1 Tax=Paenibacillus ihumii TaxID=687436 RepID=UPI001E64B4EE|nr:helix-turn-helix domain-containing protein [Paenibacillus ihumii]
MPWEEYGIESVFEAMNGKEAVHLIMAERPAIIFTDMRMPLMDGVQLLEWIHQHFPGTKVIIISGYQDYKYLQPAIVYGGTDYLLKPMNGKKIVEATERAVRKWQQEKEESDRSLHRNIQINELQPIYLDRIFTDFVTGHRRYEELYRTLNDHFKLTSGTTRCQVSVLSLEHLEQRLITRFNGDASLMYYAIINICNDVLSGEKDSHGYAFRCGIEGINIVILCWDHAKDIEGILQSINKSMMETYQIQVHFGLGEVYPISEGVPRSFEQANKAIKQRNLLCSEKRIHKHRKPDQVSEENYSFLRFFEPFKFAALSGQRDRVIEWVDKWADHMEQQPYLSRIQFEKWQREFESALLNWKVEFGWDGCSNSAETFGFDLPLDPNGNFSLSVWKEQVAANLLAFSREYASVHTLDGQLVRNIKRYIDQNFHKEITLQHIADRFFISRENISRKFKQITNENLTDYLTRLRIDKAKTLLADSGMRLTQIADLVGYQDEKYFSRVFKKITGQTPREFRKQLDSK